MEAKIWIKAWGYPNPDNPNNYQLIGEWQGEREATLQQVMRDCERWLDQYHSGDWEKREYDMPRYQNKGHKYLGAICPVTFEYDDPTRQFKFSESGFLTEHHEELTAIWQRVISGDVQTAQELAFMLEDELSATKIAATQQIEERYQGWSHRSLTQLDMDKR